MSIISGELHSVAEAIRNNGLVESMGSLLSQLRGHRSHLLDLLIESHHTKDDGGSIPVMLKGYSREKLETSLAILYRTGKKPSVESMARLTLYGTAEKRVAVLSAVVTRASRRRRGLASQTILALLSKQLPSGVPVRLVCESRAAAQLYEHIGFVDRQGKFMEK
jgi:GNAT superfamily N-acetyltransferase